VQRPVVVVVVVILLLRSEADVMRAGAVEGRAGARVRLLVLGRLLVLVVLRLPVRLRPLRTASTVRAMRLASTEEIMLLLLQGKEVLPGIEDRTANPSRRFCSKRTNSSIRAINVSLVQRSYWR
jgi:hypothetical protein